MANVNKPFGLKPVRHIDGSPWNGALQKCYVSVLNATALFIGDPVVLETTLVNKDPLAKLQTVIFTAGGSGVVIAGVVVAIEPDPTNLNRLYLPATTQGYVYIAGYRDPSIVYQVQDNAGGTPTYVYPGQNCGLAAGTGNTATGISGTVLDTASILDTQALPCHIIGISDIPGNALSNYAVWDVMINTAYNATGLVLGVVAADP